MILPYMRLSRKTNLLEHNKQPILHLIRMPLIRPPNLRMRDTLQVHQLREIYLDGHLLFL